ncbi:MAG TPA: N-acetylmuramoyl-L-alanine amidase [Solirubrobacterales bacterium]|nr:N-acetylmuramoyl-L-alanine amidase [Solirubrobacterales bacterium]
MIATHALATLLATLTLTAPHPAAGEPTATASAAAAQPLAGKVVGIDPGHNGGNFSDPGFINQPVWNGREEEACDTTGTETNGGYTEALFNFNVASYLRADLIREGAKVVMTRRTNEGVGPCIDRRARILDKAGSDVAIDIHADGGPAGGRGVAILTPVPDGPNDRVIAASKRFGRILLHRYTKVTGIPISNYDGSGGFAPRDNLAGLNLTTVPKVLIECVNMRNAADAARLVKSSFQRLAARSMAEAITVFLLSRR